MYISILKYNFNLNNIAHSGMKVFSQNMSPFNISVDKMNNSGLSGFY